MEGRTHGDTDVRDDRVLPLTRVVAYAIVPFLLVAFAVLYPWPAEIGRLFAWRIAPSLTGMVLGSAYLGGAYYFLRAGRARSWHEIKGGLVPVGVFASLMGVATIVGWDRFLHGRVAFWLWAGLYFTTPFLIFFVYWRNSRHGTRAAGADLLLPVGVARLIAAVGALAGVTGVFLFLMPASAIRIWPWTLTPLTARVLGAVFCLGVAGLGVLADRRWRSARLPLQVAFLMLVLIVVAGARAYRDLDPGNALTWLLAAGFVGLAAGIAVLYRRMERRTAPHATAPDAGPVAAGGPGYRVGD